MANIKYTKEILSEIVKESTSIRQILSKLNLKEAGGNYKNIKARLDQFGIDYSHFTGKVWSKGKRWIKKTYNLNDRLIENSTYSSGLPYSSYRLKNRLIKEGFKQKRCEICKLTEWLGQPINLELHHINGVNNDNRLENLQILCPNCHSYTENYRGKNMSALKETLEVEPIKFGESLTANPEPNCNITEGVET